MTPSFNPRSKSCNCFKLFSRYNTILLIMCCIYLGSCNSNPRQETVLISDDIEADSTYRMCYSFIDEKDTVIFQAEVHGDSVAGNLMYGFYEKDRNTGLIRGVFRGDTLIGIYTFISEGIESAREVVFLKKDTVLLEGYGKLMQHDDSIVFEDVNKLKFDGLILQKKPCPDIR